MAPQRILSAGVHVDHIPELLAELDAHHLYATPWACAESVIGFFGNGFRLAVISSFSLAFDNRLVLSTHDLLRFSDYYVLSVLGRHFVLRRVQRLSQLSGAWVAALGTAVHLL
jgi:hypothetical protein